MEDRGDDSRQTTEGCRWREKRTHLERATASNAQCIQRTTTETSGTGCHKHVGQTRDAGGTTVGPDDEATKRSPMDEESTSMPNPGSASSSSTAAPDPCVTTPVRQTTPRSPGPPESVTEKSLVSPLPKKLLSAIGEDDDNMEATIAEITEVCEEPQPDWESLASSENVGSTWSTRRHGVRMVHLGHLREHKVYDELDLPQGIKPLSMCRVDKDDYHTAKSRLTARGYEQELTGQENFYSATPQPATLRVLLVLAQALGLTVAVGDCAQAFLQAPLLEKSDVWVTPPPEAEVKPGRARLPLKTLPDLQGGPAAWGHHATRVKEERYGLIQSARDPCVHSIDCPFQHIQPRNLPGSRNCTSLKSMVCPMSSVNSLTLV